MTKESGAMLGCEGVQRTGQGRLEFVHVTSRRLAQMRFEFGKGQFDRIEVGAVRWQVAQFDALGLKQRLNALDLVRAQIVQIRVSPG